MRVLHVVEGWQPVTTGNAIRSLALVEAQARRTGLAPHVLVSSRQRAYGVEAVEQPAGVPVRAVPPSKQEQMLRRVRPFWTDRPHLTRAVARAARDVRADLIHVHWSSAIGRAAAYAAEKAGCPFVAEVRFDLAGGVMSESLPFESRLVENLLRRWNEQHLAHADAVIAASYTLGDLVRETFPHARGRLTVIPNALDTDLFRPGPPPAEVVSELNLQDKFVIGSTGSMYHYEGFDVLIRTLADLKKRLPQVRGLLIGDGPRRAELEALAERLGAPVTFYGPVPREAVRRCYRLFDLFVVPRRDVSITRHASPLKLLEAMASACACVATPMGDVAHLLADGRGRLVPPGSESALAEALATLANDGEARAAMGRHARAYVEDRPSWDAAAATHARLYAGLLRRPAPRQAASDAA